MGDELQHPDSSITVDVFGDSCARYPGNAVARNALREQQQGPTPVDLRPRGVTSSIVPGKGMRRTQRLGAWEGQ
jgi:hypothetical protein